jgi:tRNA nucleotidyltransferase (CCA-adding enzyme)
MLQGRDLISMGLKPSPKFKEILEKVYQLQLEGALESREEALAYVAEHLI